MDALPAGADSNEALASAVLLGSVDSVKKFIQKGADADQRGERANNATLLMRCLDSHGRNGIPVENVVGCVQALLEAHADVNATDANGKTALHRAFALQLTAVAEVLISGGAIAKRCSGGGCQKCILSHKMALRRKPHIESVVVRKPIEAAKKAEEDRKGSYERVLSEEFGDGDFMSALAEAKEELARVAIHGEAPSSSESTQQAPMDGAEEGAAGEEKAAPAKRNRRSKASRSKRKGGASVDEHPGTAEDAGDPDVPGIS